ncbi:uncharacterized protein LOC112271427 [Brachypodium distachyon]|uniref:uncharacterized protein LOC112271427 n=1 Tax=Brachypodium distachyon TaxID=15368 RepID=UPI000D0CE0E3|nr:uncharacterized protein LOC112271427 [Brachypodium distachyon]|eukprot:XP_024316232.1 uncharacterized protein LOC112271427 [Brachypodium distachyon]
MGLYLAKMPMQVRPTLYQQASAIHEAQAHTPKLCPLRDRNQNVTQTQYSGCDVLEATPTAGISYTWRSILKGIHTLKLGLIWRVGVGRTIKIWEDPWIPRDSTRKPITPRGNSNYPSLVSDLIAPLCGVWDEHLIRHVFWEEDADLILKIPIHLAFSDVVAWHPDPKWLFSVKSAYHLTAANEEKESTNGGGGSASELGGQILWNKLWNSCVPNKTKHFLWRLAHNTIAVRMNLRYKGMDIDSNCLFCSCKFEDTGHLLFKCKQVRQLWRGLGMEEERLVFSTKTNAHDVFEILLNMNYGKLALVAFLLWNRWLQRNKVRDGESLRPVEDLIFSVRNQTSSFLETSEKTNSRSSRLLTMWQKPKMGWIKINSDGSFIAESNSGG